ncbi:MAG: DUF3810 domain-containing protein [bacterium]
MRSPTKLRAGVIGVALSFYLLLQLLSNYPESVEKYYTNGIYPTLALIFSKISGPLPFSLTELLLWGAIFVGLSQTINRIKQRKLRLGPLVLNVLSFASLVYIWFYLFWGINYMRLPLRARLDLETVHLEMDSFDSTFVDIIRNGNHLNLAYSMRDIDEINANIDSSYGEVFSKLGLKLFKHIQHGKTFVGNWIFNETTTSGFFSPFFHEIHYNRDMLVFELPFVLAHEKAHFLGYTSEAEANFLAYLVCINAKEPLVRYSGYFSLLNYFFLSLGDDKERQKTFAALLNDGVKLDLVAVRERWMSHAGVISRFSSKGYDLYLKANQVAEGIQNYSKVVDLIIRYYGKTKTIAKSK